MKTRQTAESACLRFNSELHNDAKSVKLSREKIQDGNLLFKKYRFVNTEDI